MMINTSPLVLLILDGWGYSPDPSHNAILSAYTPHWDHWWQTRPHLLLDASGTSVGLPPDQMGNSEVGHMHIGAGRVILQDLTRINAAITSHTWQNNPVLLETIHALKKSQRTLHLMGLFSPGGVHSHENHLFAALKLCAQEKFNDIVLHLFLDGRDTAPQSAKISLDKLQTLLNDMPGVRIGSLCGRYYAMDRDHRWSRMAPLYRLLTEGVCAQVADQANEAIDVAYQQNLSDEFIPPTRIGHTPPLQDGDAVFFFNFRADRAQQLTQAFIDPDFHGFARAKRPQLSAFLSMTPYGDHLNTTVVFQPEPIKNTLGEILAQHHLRQLRLAETEKYAHVTFFFNGGTHHTFAHEERRFIPSPNVATYDLAPHMSAEAITQTLTQAIEHRTHDVIICNYANADMVGHTGNFPATVSAIEALDEAIGKVWHALQSVGGILLITADHGNAECMFDDSTHQKHTAHTTHPVPLLYLGSSEWTFNTTHGNLIDIAPTILTLLGITPPSEMTGHVLLSKVQGV